MLQPLSRPGTSKTVAVIGGGFAGGLFALKLSAAKPAWRILLIERGARAGVGLAYGACGPQHVLNVPVSRMEVGLRPSFAEWLRQRPAHLSEALDESGGSLADAFVPRQLFGDYLEQQISRTLAQSGTGLRRVAGEVVSVSSALRRVVLSDGRSLDANAVVIATGNQPPRLPISAKPSINIISNPWNAGALDAIGLQTPLLLVGSGLTMIDVLLSLEARGHKGPIHVISRHGLLPQAHEAGGSWGPVLRTGNSPIEALRKIRTHVREAQANGIPWQRVFDAVRPAVAPVWHAWSIGQRAQFLRHLRAIWDVHRHRMPARIARSIGGLIISQRLTVVAGRVLALDEGVTGITAVIRQRKGQVRLFEVGAVINCTGPQMDLRHSAHPLFQALNDQSLIQSDPLGLGLESEDCALKAAGGAVSDWLYALGPVTRPAWWEIVAVPEINTQVERLVRKISDTAEAMTKPLSSLFLDIGAGI